jgi:hypothetical protein
MSFGSTLTVTVNAVAKVLNRINQDNYGSEYALLAALEEYRVLIRHSKITRAGKTFDRHNVQITHIVYATSTVAEIERRCYIVFENAYNDDKTLMGYLTAGFVDYVDNATVQSDLITWQS